MSVSRSTICRGCWQQMKVPIGIRGPYSIPFRLFGIRTSQMNPNLCTICETMFTRVKRNRQLTIPATVLFADLRGFTSLAQSSGSGEIVGMLHEFYDTCASVVWERDGIVNKFIGDGVLAIFNFPIAREDSVRQAVLAGIELQRQCMRSPWIAALDAHAGGKPVGVGIGIHTGQASIGQFGTAYKDFTIIGSMVNLASRIQGAAAPGEVLVTEQVYAQVSDLYPGLPGESHQLKGIDAPVTAYRLPAAQSPVIA